MSDILILNAHPGRARLAHAVADAYARGAEEAGVSVSHLRLAELAFDPILHAGHADGQPLEPDLLAARAAIERCRHLTIVSPLWWGADPALLKGFVDRLFLPQWAFRYDARGFPVGLLAGRSARVIRTMDSPWFWYALVVRWPGDAALDRATLRFCGFGPVAKRNLYDVHAKTRATRTATSGQPAGATDSPRLQRDLDAVTRDGRKDAGRVRRAPALPARTSPNAAAR